MKEETKAILQELTERYPTLKSIKKDILFTYEILLECFEKGNRLYLCGNGGSASDCEHIAGELLKKFKKCRPLEKSFSENLKKLGDEGVFLADSLEGGLSAVSLCGHPSLSTAFANDNDPLLCFAQQLGAFGNKGDVLMAISTSGNAKNCAYAALVAKAKEMKVVFLGGGNGGKLKELADVSVIVPEKETFKVQELHLPVYHCLCAMLESELF